jgi:hypothetical protein
MIHLALLIVAGYILLHAALFVFACIVEIFE